MKLSQVYEDLLKSRKLTKPYNGWLFAHISIYFSVLFIRMGLKAEQVCVSWGIINVINGYFVYLSIIGVFYWIPFFVLIYSFTDLLDLTDGEIARYRNHVDPIIGKLLDGIGHRMTEYSILIAFTLGSYVKTGQICTLLLGLIAIFGEAIYTYCNERKLLVIRLYAKESVHQEMIDETIRYSLKKKWSEFKFKEQIKFIQGLFQYRSVYLIVFLSYLSDIILILGLTVLAVYKNYAWIKMIVGLVRNRPELKDDAVDKSTLYWKQKSE
ncbi:MAG: hypothetical protein ABH886_08385 [Candidatus Desantisbacteria bacterium]